MAAILIVAHLPLASALLAAARHVYPEKAEHLIAVDVDPSLPTEAIEAEARSALARWKDAEVLILTDVFGATPCNIAQKLADGVNVRVVAGVNVPMLWRSLCYVKEPLEALVMRALAGATQGIMHVVVTKPQNQTQLPVSNDPCQPVHQQ